MQMTDRERKKGNITVHQTKPNQTSGRLVK